MNRCQIALLEEEGKSPLPVRLRRAPDPQDAIVERKSLFCTQNRQFSGLLRDTTIRTHA